jgi:hypothetical protein
MGCHAGIRAFAGQQDRLAAQIITKKIARGSNAHLYPNFISRAARWGLPQVKNSVKSDTTV